MPTNSADDRVSEVKTVVEVPLPVFGFIRHRLVNRFTAVFGDLIQNVGVVVTGHIVLLE